MTHADSRAMTLVVRGPIARADLPGICERVRALMSATNGGLIECTVAGVEDDVVTIEMLARLQLAAREHDCRVRLLGASPGLRELVSLLGLDDVF